MNAVSPGVVNTPWWDFLPPETNFEMCSKQVPVRRAGQPDDIAGAVLFLAKNEFMTGKVIGCDGGIE